MKKNTFKIIGLLILLTISFIYTEKIFTISRNNDPLMKEIIEYKKDNDFKPVNAIIKDNEIILGLSGNEVHTLDSYKNMKEDDFFSENKIIKYREKPKDTIEDNYNYYITSSNKINKKVYIILKINKVKELENIYNLNNNIALFINEQILDSYFIDTNLEIYNLEIDNNYKNIKDINKIIEENYNKSIYCLNENKNDKYKNICKKNKMYTIKPSLINPNIKALKKNLENGLILSYDINKISFSKLKSIIKVIEAKGYKIDKLSNLIKE